MKNISNKIDNNKLNELVEIISLCHNHIIGGIPAGQLLSLKKELESRKELSDYTFAYGKPLGKYNTLNATKNYGVKNA